MCILHIDYGCMLYLWCCVDKCLWYFDFVRLHNNICSSISWSTHWFKCVMVIPKEWAGRQVRFRWDSNCEAMVSVTVVTVCQCGGFKEIVAT